MNPRLVTLATIKLLITALLAIFGFVELFAAVHFAKVAFAMLGGFYIIGAVLLLPSRIKEKPHVIALAGLIFAAVIAAAVPMALIDEKFPKSCSGRSSDLCHLLNYIYGQGGSFAVAATWALLAFLVALASFFIVTCKAARCPTHPSSGTR
jgi:hypothetical protein